MERNENQPDTANADSTGSTARAGGYDFAGTSSTELQPQGLRERAMNIASEAGDRLSDVGSTIRDRASGAKDKLAGALETGAERLRAKTHGADTTTTAGDGAASAIGDGRVAQISDRVAGGMETTAAWLRDADLESLKLGVEKQVKEHPVRTLIIAAGLGYLIGRAFRGGNQTSV